MIAGKSRTNFLPDPSFFSEEESQILEKIWDIGRNLKNYFIQRDEIIDTMFISLLCKQHTLLIGPWGSAKSNLIEYFTQTILGYSYFGWLLTKFTTPEELFGPYSIEALKNSRYERIPTGKLQEAHIIFLDEVFNGNSAILNSMLKAMNERVFEGKSIPLQTIFGATNHIPKKGNQGAYFDRFLFRHFVQYIDGEERNFTDLLQLESFEISTTISAEEIAILEAKIKKVSMNHILPHLTKLWQFLRAENIHASDRRWRWAKTALQAQALLDGRKEVLEDDLHLLKCILWTEKKEIRIIESAIMKTISPIAAQIQELYQDAVQLDADLKTLDSQDTDDQKKIAEKLNKLKEISEEIETISVKPQLSEKEKNIAVKLQSSITNLRMKNMETKLGVNF